MKILKILKISKKLLFIVLFIFGFFVLIGCQANKNAEDLGLSTVGNSEKLKSLFKQSENQNRYGFPGGIFAENSTDMEAPQTDSKSGSSDYTKTNVQVEGVDEGDIVKTDGNRIYSISYNQLHVVEADNGNLELILEDKIQSDDASKTNYTYTYYSELYVTDKYFIVIGQKWQYHWMKYAVAEDSTNPEAKTDAIYYPSVPTSVITLYDVDTLTKVKEYEVSGYLLGSRLIDNNLYLISSYYIYNYVLTDDTYDPRPFIIEDGTEEKVSYDDIKYVEDTVYQSFTLITNIGLFDTVTDETDTFLGASYWGNIYVSKESIYLTYTTYEVGLLGQYKEKGIVISYQFVDGNVVYGGSGEYSGYVINQFSIDEYNGYLRIVTTSGWGETAKNRLYVFERVIVNDAYLLKVVGMIDEGLGKPNERVQSVRFNKDKATVVTYEQTDPFYTIDLSDPTKPTIIGALEVPGFSTYQHPWKENYIIGIGYNAENGMTTGMKISLYDISDMENPVEVGTPLILSKNTNNNWSYSEALWNHKAIYMDPSHNSFGFSLWRSSWNNNYYYASNDYIVFDVDETKAQPITIKYTINHQEFNQNDTTYYWNYDYVIERALRIDNHLYVISNRVITSHNLIGEIGVVDSIIFSNYNQLSRN